MVDILHWKSNENSAAGIAAQSGEKMHSQYTANLADDFRIAKLMGTINILDSDLGTDVCIIPFLVDGDLSAGEVEQCIEALLVDQGDTTLTEQSRRRVFPLVDATGLPIWFGGGNGESVKSFSTKVNQTFRAGKGWEIYYYNLGATAATSNPMNATIYSKIYGVWVD